MKWYYVVAIVVAILLLLLTLVLIVNNKKNDKKVEEFPNLLLALGGKENINEVSFKGSRVSVLLENKKLINKEGIKNEGVETIVVSNKKVTMVVGKNSEIIFNYLNNEISK